MLGKGKSEEGLLVWRGEERTRARQKQLTEYHIY